MRMQLVRLHRRCLFEDMNSAEAATSRTACRSSSSLLLQLAHEFRQRSDCAHKFWFVPRSLARSPFFG